MQCGSLGPQGTEGRGYHLVCLGGIDAIQDALNSVQLGVQGLNAFLCPLLGLERPQCLAGMETDQSRTW